MTDQDLRALVREAIRLHGVRQGGQIPSGAGSPAFAMPLPQQHASHTMFVLPTGSDADGPCIIEPAVLCNHCGYCKSYGH